MPVELFTILILRFYKKLEVTPSEEQYYRDEQADVAEYWEYEDYGAQLQYVQKRIADGAVVKGKKNRADEQGDAADARG